jgi:hypothetical protein
VNFPNVEELTFQSKSSTNIINTILQSFPHLTSLHFCPNRDNIEDYVHQEGLRHENLKKLDVGSRVSGINNDFVRLIRSCSKLEGFSAASELIKNLLKESISNITPSDIVTVKENGKKLETFLIENCAFDDDNSPTTLREEFSDQFNKVKLSTFRSKYKWKMEKSLKNP